MKTHAINPVTILTILTILMPVPGAPSAHAVSFAKVGIFGGQLERHGHSGRSVALGAADLADARGVFAPLATAAPLRGPDGVAAGYSHSEFFANIEIEILGLAAEYQGFRLSIVETGFSMDPMEVRTAYQPEGTGETFEAGYEFTTVGLSVDLLPLILDRPADWAWTAGISRHAIEMRLAEAFVEEYSWEAGSTVAWSRPVPEGRLTVAAGVHQRGLEEGDYNYDGRKSPLPRWRDVGFCATLTRDLHERTGDELAFRILGGARKDLVSGGDGTFGKRRYGFELTVLEILSLRTGRDTSNPAMEDGNYGAGIRWAEPWLRRVQIRYDYASFHLSYLDLDMDQHSVQLRFRF